MPGTGNPWCAIRRYGMSTGAGWCSWRQLAEEWGVRPRYGVGKSVWVALKVTPLKPLTER